MPRPDFECPTDGAILEEHPTRDNEFVCPHCGKVYTVDDLIHELNQIIDGENRYKLN